MKERRILQPGPYHIQIFQFPFGMKSELQAAEKQLEEAKLSIPFWDEEERIGVDTSLLEAAIHFQFPFGMNAAFFADSS